MQPYDAAGKVLMVGLPGTRIDRETSGLLLRLQPHGIILFRRNLTHVEALAELMLSLPRHAPGVRLVALDQEGGSVNRLEPWVGALPSAARIAEAGPDVASRLGRSIARVMRALGFNLDFAPVVDLCAPGAANGIGNRSFGVNPSVVTSTAGAFLDALQQEGVAGCLKHFPGLGRTDVDSHARRPVCMLSTEQLEAEDLAPFRALVPRAAGVMISHAVFPALDPTGARPASLCPEIVRGLLRERLGFRGLIVSDDLEMGAVAGMDASGEAAVAAVAAGCDLVLYCRDLEKALRAAEALRRGARSSPALEARLQEATLRVETLARRWPLVQPDLESWNRARGELVADAAATDLTEDPNL